MGSRNLSPNGNMHSFAGSNFENEANNGDFNHQSESTPHINHRNLQNNTCNTNNNTTISNNTTTNTTNTSLNANTTPSSNIPPTYLPPQLRQLHSLGALGLCPPITTTTATTATTATTTTTTTTTTSPPLAPVTMHQGVEDIGYKSETDVQAPISNVQRNGEEDGDDVQDGDKGGEGQFTIEIGRNQVRKNTREVEDLEWSGEWTWSGLEWSGLEWNGRL